MGANTEVTRSRRASDGEDEVEDKVLRLLTVVFS